MRKQFKATEGLLEDVMRKQAGSIEKAILEAVMNSVDAGASSINIVVEEDIVVIEDDGKGLSSDEVEEYFEKFGLKDSDIEDKDFGKFRMGRGQIFNFGENIWHSQDNILVVDLDNEYTYVHKDLFGDLDEDEINGYEGDKVVLENEGLCYHFLNASSDYEGCRITVKLNQPIDPDHKEHEIQKLIRYIPWLHDVEVKINGEEVYEEPESYVETERAYFVFEPDKYGSNTRIYNQGAFVKSEGLTNTNGVIITRVDLDVNFSRNDILENDETWNEIKDEYLDETVNYLTTKDSLNKRARRWLLEMAAEREWVQSFISDIPIIDDVAGNTLRFKDLEGESLVFGPKGSAQAEELAHSSNSLVLDDSYESSFTDLINAIGSEKKDYEESVESDMKWEMEEWDYSDLQKTRQRNFDWAEWLLREVGYRGQIKVGYSKHFKSWKAEEETNETVFIDKAFLKAPKDEWVLEKIPHVIEVAAQSGDSRSGLSHGFGFKDSWWEYSQNMGQYQRQLLNGEADVA